MFQNLTEKLANAFKRFRSKGKLTAADVNIFVPYVYEEDNATKFENFADAATIPSRVVVEGLGRDVCDHHQVYFYITSPY